MPSRSGPEQGAVEAETIPESGIPDLFESLSELYSELPESGEDRAPVGARRTSGRAGRPGARFRIERICPLHPEALSTLKLSILKRSQLLRPSSLARRQGSRDDSFAGEASCSPFRDLTSL